MQWLNNLINGYIIEVKKKYQKKDREKLDENDPDCFRRMTNGPIESFNNIPSSYRLQSKGIENFEFARNRILWTIRADTPIFMDHYDYSKIKNKRPLRGPYKKTVT